MITSGRDLPGIYKHVRSVSCEVQFKIYISCVQVSALLLSDVGLNAVSCMYYVQSIHGSGSQKRTKPVLTNSVKKKTRVRNLQAYINIL